MSCHYWGISPPAEFVCIIIWVILWFWVTWSGHSSYQSSLSRGRTYIDRSSSCQFESGPHLYRSAIFLSVQFESGPHLYRSVIVLSVRVWGRTYIDRPSSYQFSSSRDRTYIDRSFITSVWVWAAPISIDHLPISSVWVGTAPISIGHCFVGLSWVLFTFESHLHSWVFFAFWVAIIPPFWFFRVIFLTQLPGAYCLIVIALLDFPFHCTWHSSLIPWCVFLSCRWAPYT